MYWLAGTVFVGGLQDVETKKGDDVATGAKLGLNTDAASLLPQSQRPSPILIKIEISPANQHRRKR
jgi:hypothetical protein